MQEIITVTFTDNYKPVKLNRTTTKSTITTPKFHEGISKDSSSLDGTSAIVTLARREEAPDTPQRTPGEATVKQWVYRPLTGDLGECRC